MKKVAILTGGVGSERPISITSAENARKALADRYSVQVFTLPEDLVFFIHQRKHFTVAVPIIHGQGGEDGAIQGLLEWLQIPYVFSDIHGQAVALNKLTAKRIVASAGILTPHAELYETRHH